MNEKHTAPASPSINVGDIYHVVFRHKWKILIIWALGLIATVIIWRSWPVIYQSNAQILVRYVVDNTTTSPVGGGSTRTPGQEGDTLVYSEVVILQSLDTALPVVEQLGASNILAKLGGGTDKYVAAQAIQSHLKAEAPKGSAVIFVTFQHPDPVMAKTILGGVVDSYLKRSAEIHQAASTLDEFLQRQTTDLRTKWNEVENRLRDLKNSVNISSLEDSRKAFTESVASLQNQLATARAELASRLITLNEMTNTLAAAAGTNSPTTEPVDSAISEQYGNICALIDSQKKEKMQRILVYPPTSPRIAAIQREIEANEKLKKQLEAEYPQLVGTHESGDDVKPMFSRADIFRQIIQVKELQAKIDSLNTDLAGVKTNIANVNQKETQITDLEHQSKLYESYLNSFSANLLTFQIQEQAGPGRITNISPIQRPSPAYRDTKKLTKTMAMTFGGSFAGAVALAFLIELILDRSFKRPIEIENRLGVPLFLSIPKTKLNGRSRLPGFQPKGLLTGGSPEANNGNGNGDTNRSGTAEIAPLEHDGLRPFFETLRDRLITYFEVRNMIHKPKLVAVTSCAEGSGVSTVASGLAESLSETGDGNVLLVDMKDIHSGAAHYFRKGKLELGLDEALEDEKRDGAMVQDNLYVVAESVNDTKLPRILHKRFSNLMPKLRASDYDYIIFDMPPVSQISPTPRLARFMDMVFMVVEAERNDRDVVKRATDMLAESNANVGVVLNKNRNYVPRKLQQQL